MGNKNLLNIAREVIRIETSALKKLQSSIGKSFELVVKSIWNP